MGFHEKAQNLTEEMLEAIEDKLGEGHFEKTVYQILEINPRTWEYWKHEARALREKLQTGEVEKSSLKKGDHKILRLLQICEKGRAVAVAQALENIKQAGKDPRHWQANAWYLERTEPELFGKKDRHEISGPGGGPIVHTDLTEEEKARFTENLAEFFPGMVDGS